MSHKSRGSQVWKNLSITENNYEALSKLGYASDSMNDVVGMIVNKILQLGLSRADLEFVKTVEATT